MIIATLQGKRAWQADYKIRKFAFSNFSNLIGIFFIDKLGVTDYN